MKVKFKHRLVREPRRKFFLTCGFRLCHHEYHMYLELDKFYVLKCEVRRTVNSISNKQLACKE
jgi:hypothetical protein